NQCRTHSLVESEKVLSLAPNHRVRLPISSSSNPIYAISPGSLIHAMRINHDMCVFAHIHSLPLGVPAGADEAPPRAAASALEVEVRVRVLVALDDRFAGEGMQLVLARPQLD